MIFGIWSSWTKLVLLFFSFTPVYRQFWMERQFICFLYLRIIYSFLVATGITDTAQCKFLMLHSTLWFHKDLHFWSCSNHLALVRNKIWCFSYTVNFTVCLFSSLNLFRDLIHFHFWSALPSVMHKKLNCFLFMDQTTEWDKIYFFCVTVTIF